MIYLCILLYILHLCLGLKSGRRFFCMCVCVWGGGGGLVRCVCVRVYVCARACVRACVCARVSGVGCGEGGQTEHQTHKKQDCNLEWQHLHADITTLTQLKNCCSLLHLLFFSARLIGCLGDKAGWPNTSRLARPANHCCQLQLSCQTNLGQLAHAGIKVRKHQPLTQRSGACARAHTYIHTQHIYIHNTIHTHTHTHSLSLSHTHTHTPYTPFSLSLSQDGWMDGWMDEERFCVPLLHYPLELKFTHWLFFSPPTPLPLSLARSLARSPSLSLSLSWSMHTSCGYGDYVISQRNESPPGHEYFRPCSHGNRHRVQELCESRGGRPGLPVPYSLCGRKATLDWSKIASTAHKPY